MQVFETRYLGRSPKCPNCMENERRIERAKERLGEALRRWREKKFKLLLQKASMEEGRDASTRSLVAILKKPEFARLLPVGTPELWRELPESLERTSRPRFYGPASLLATLCSRLDPISPLEESFLNLIRLLIVAYPQAVVPSDDYTWTHPVNFLCRGDPLFSQCRDAMLQDVRWDPGIHPLLPHDVQITYVLLARILWKHNVGGGGDIFRCVASFLPPVIDNAQSRAGSCRTVLEIANDNGVFITEACWSEVTLDAVSLFMTEDIGMHFNARQLSFLPAHQRFALPDFFELDGIVGVPERRSSGKVCLTCAFRKAQDSGLRSMMSRRVLKVKGAQARALGIPSPSRVLMTSNQKEQLLEQTSKLGEISPGVFSEWFIIGDMTPVDAAHDGLTDGLLDEWD